MLEWGKKKSGEGREKEETGNLEKAVLLHQDRAAFLVKSVPSPFGEECHG